jgi:hypothetical protein
MILPTMDGRGNLHRNAGPGAGQFASKAPAAPSSMLGEAAERLRASVRISWRHIFDASPATARTEEPGPRDRLSWLRRDRNKVTSSASDTSSWFTTNVSIPTYTNQHAPVTLVVDSRIAAASGDEVAREYRAVDGKLFRQVWGIEDPVTGQITPAHGEWAPTEAGRSYELHPVPADEEWLRQQTERNPTITAASEAEAAQLAQKSMDEFAAIDGDVWQQADAPVYRAPVIADAPFDGPLAVTVTAAPDTTAAAADLGYFHADSYSDAIRTMQDTAAALQIPIAEGHDSDDPPIRILRDLGLVGDEPEWRAGTPLNIEPSETLTEETFRDRLAAFREQIVTIPGAVTGDVGSFLVVGNWKVDFAALTRQQQDEYRRHITYGVERGLI